MAPARSDTRTFRPGLVPGIVCLAIAAFGGPLAPAHALAGGNDLRSIASDIAHHHALPRVEALASATAALDRSIATYCDERGAGTSGTVHEAFGAALAAWMGVEHLRFGPLAEDDRYWRIQFWPDKHGQGARQLRKLLSDPSQPVPDATAIGEASAAIQGLPALERLLFGDGSAPAAADDTDRVCLLMTAIGDNLAAMAEAALNDWRALAAELDSGTGTRAGEFLASAFRAFADQLEFIADLKLDRPLGKSEEAARPRQAQNWRSSMALANIEANLAALDELYGGNAEAGSHGLAAVLDTQGPEGDYRTAIGEGLRYGATFLRERPMDMASAVHDQEQRDSLAFLALHIRQMRDMALAHLAPALGVAAGFNAMDGD